MKKKSKDAYIVSGGKDKKKSTNKNKKDQNILTF